MLFDVDAAAAMGKIPRGGSLTGRELTAVLSFVLVKPSRPRYCFAVLSPLTWHFSETVHIKYAEVRIFKKWMMLNLLRDPFSQQ